ncbi:hypothetical protein Drorol1_Dr00005277, partial [Drosera rotundifolia]
KKKSPSPNNRSLDLHATLFSEPPDPNLIRLLSPLSPRFLPPNSFNKHLISTAHLIQVPASLQNPKKSQFFFYHGKWLNLGVFIGTIGFLVGLFGDSCFFLVKWVFELKQLGFLFRQFGFLLWFNWVFSIGAIGVVFEI